jgi:hypothetical protein
MKAGKITEAYQGELEIDYKNGVVTFKTRVGRIRLLRVTHLPDPIPAGMSIDLVALPALTSYTPQELEPEHELP